MSVENVDNLNEPIEDINNVDIEELLDKKIGTKEVQEANEILRKYKEGKKNLESRVISCEEWWKSNHWSQFKSQSNNRNDPKPTSSWLFNSVINKHADMMDNFPEPNVLPRQQDDEAVAEALSEILPVVLENNDFEHTYNSVGWDKLKTGTGIYGVFFNTRLQKGLGDIDIKQLDMLNIFWEPGITDIQASRNLFIVELVDIDLLKTRYEELADKISNTGIDISKYEYDDTVDTSNKTMVVDWYYKVNSGIGDVLHYVKYVGDVVLYASENEKEYTEKGYYDHGMYPVVFDVMFEEKGTPAGFGYIDIMKDPQEYIDKLDQAILKNALVLAKPRYFIHDNCGINEEEFANIDNDFVHVASSLEDTHVQQIVGVPIPAQYLEVKQLKVDELKETSGNRDFSQGTTTAGVTAASAIAALQEAGSKTSRDMNKGSYRAYQKLCNIVIELIRQFYDEPRTFRILGDSGKAKYVNFSNAGMKQEEPTEEFGVELYGKLPVFDIKVRPQKSSPFSRLSQNELALQFYDKGFFNPQLSDQALATIEMMDFEGKQSVKEKIQENGTLYQTILQMQQQMQAMASVIEQATGDGRLSAALAGNQDPIEGISSNPVGGDSAIQTTDSYGNLLDDTSQAGKARLRTGEAASVK